MRICRLVWGFPKAHELTYGLGPNFYFISKEQAKLGVEINVVARRKPGEGAYEEVEGIRVHRVKFPYNINALRKIRELDSKFGVDLVHAHGTCGLLYPAIPKKIRCPLVVHAHSISLGMKRHAYRLPKNRSLKLFLKSRFREETSILRERLYWPHSDLLIAVSQAQKAEIEEYYGVKQENINVIYNGVEKSIFKPLRDTQPLRDTLGLHDKQVILFVGHFVLRKGIPLLLKAMPEILGKIPNAFLLCVGGTPKWLGTQMYWTYLQEIIDRKNLAGHVKLVGQIPHQDLPYYYSLSDVFAFPSLYEAFAKVILEAMACETPVVASRVGGLPEAIEHNVNGILVDPKNVNQLASAIIEILQDRKVAQRMGKKGRDVVTRRFTWQHTVKELSKTYHELIQTHAKN
ncbi:MAG: glycosyltransferase family 4 protein [Candidatus Bathyarchaeota archaeon]|nr:MAG: glycosyltransferase family 4 protein [Candidatus Bathyarchaeota archaeon]